MSKGSVYGRSSDTLRKKLWERQQRFLAAYIAKGLGIELPNNLHYRRAAQTLTVNGTDRGDYWAENPPSTSKYDPVTKEDSSEAKNNAA